MSIPQHSQPMHGPRMSSLKRYKGHAQFVKSVENLKAYSLNVKEWKTPLFTFRAVPHMALQKEWWLFHSFRGVSLQDRVKNHSKRCKLQSKRVEDHSKKSCPSYGSSKSAFHSFTLKEYTKMLRTDIITKSITGAMAAMDSAIYGPCRNNSLGPSLGGLGPRPVWSKPRKKNARPLNNWRSLNSSQAQAWTVVSKRAYESISVKQNGDGYL